MSPKSVLIISNKCDIIKCIKYLFNMDKALTNRLARDFPEIQFRNGKKFLFKPPKTVVLGPEEPNDALLLMHEIGHALLKHRTFNVLATRLKMEREAWEKARELCEIYGVKYDEEVAERELDTYREWLDQKSRCPRCGLTRFQTPDGEFHCPRCDIKQLS